MGKPDDSSMGDVLQSEFIDLTDLDVEQVLATEDTPLALCVRRLIRQNSRSVSTVAGFDSFLGEDEPPDGV